MRPVPRLLPIVLLAALLGTLEVSTATPAAAACNPRAALERAEAAIERAADEVARSPVREAQDLLRAARERLRQGVDRAGKGDRETACRLAVVAEKLAVKALDLARRGNRSVAELQRLLARTDEWLTEAASAVQRSGSAPAERMLTAAFRQQKEARRGFRSGRLRLALKLTLLARDTAQRALVLARGGAARDRAWVEKSLAETDRLLEEATRLTSGEGAGRTARDLEEILSRSHRMQEEARRHFAAGRARLALQLTRQARLFALRALDRMDVVPSREEVTPLLEATAELVGRLRSEAAEAEDRKADKLLDRASRLLDDARDAMARGEVRKALGEVRAASALALQAAEGLGSGARN